jgi:hypothetical protein
VLLEKTRGRSQKIIGGHYPHKPVVIDYGKATNTRASHDLDGSSVGVLEVTVVGFGFMISRTVIEVPSGAIEPRLSSAKARGELPVHPDGPFHLQRGRA